MYHSSFRPTSEPPYNAASEETTIAKRFLLKLREARLSVCAVTEAPAQEQKRKSRSCFLKEKCTLKDKKYLYAGYRIKNLREHAGAVYSCLK